MINCAGWLRAVYPWPPIRLLKCNQLCSYCNHFSTSESSNGHEKSQSIGQKISQINQNINKRIDKKLSQKTIGDRNGKALKKTPDHPRNEDKRRDKWHLGYTIFLSVICGSMLWAVYELGRPEQDQFGRSIEDDFSMLPLLQQYLQRMWHSLQYYQKMLREPQPIKLLPDVQQYPYIQPRYTLVLEMRDVLVHPDWTYQTGWRFKKRPGVDHFLRQCSQHFEIVIYTAEQGMTAFPIIDALDPRGYIRYRLVRSTTQLVDGQHVKNLSLLNRNLRRVIVVDWDRRAVLLHPDNLFAIARWVGNDDDVQLFDLAAFLGLIAEHKMDDVREVLHYYSQFEDPIEQFKENQRKLLEMKQEKPDAEACLTK